MISRKTKHEKKEGTLFKTVGNVMGGNCRWGIAAVKHLLRDKRKIKGRPHVKIFNVMTREKRPGWANVEPGTKRETCRRN